MAKNYSITHVISRKLTDEELASLLPSVVVDIAKIIGFEKALLLVKGMGGVDFAVPCGLSRNGSEREQRLVDAIGIEAAKKFMRIFGGERLYIPQCEQLLRAERNRRFCECIDAAIDTGMTQTNAVQKLAYEFGLSERYSYEILKQYRTYQANRVVDERQLDLFDNQGDANG